MDDDLLEMSPLPRRRGLDRLPLHIQLVTLIGGLVVLVALCGAVAVALVVKLGDDGERLADRSAYTENIAAAALDAKSVANDERGYLITGEEHFRLEAERGISDATTQFRAATAAATTPCSAIRGQRFRRPVRHLDSRSSGRVCCIPPGASTARHPYGHRAKSGASQAL